MADQELEIAEDGVQEVALTVARPRLTRLIEQVLEDDVVSALTVRSRRRVYLVSPDFYERALEDRRVAEALVQAVNDLPDEERAPIAARLKQMPDMVVRDERGETLVIELKSYRS